MGRSLRLRDAFHTDGSMAIEYGLILPVLLLFTFGLVDAGRLLWTNITLTRATEVAARCGAVNMTTCPAAGIAAYAAAEAQNFGITTPRLRILQRTPAPPAACRSSGLTPSNLWFRGSRSSRQARHSEARP